MGPHDATRSTYSWPSTSVIRAPDADAMKRGVPPTAWNARTGEFTPPGVTARARRIRAAETGTGSAPGTPAFSPVPPNAAKPGGARRDARAMSVVHPPRCGARSYAERDAPRSARSLQAGRPVPLFSPRPTTGYFAIPVHRVGESHAPGPDQGGFSPHGAEHRPQAA